MMNVVLCDFKDCLIWNGVFSLLIHWKAGTFSGLCLHLKCFIMKLFYSFWEKIKELFYSSLEKIRTAAETQPKHGLSSVIKSVVNEFYKKIEEKCRNLSKTHWLLIIAGYITLFWSISIGLLVLIITVIYIGLRKYNPTKAEQLVASLKGRFQNVIKRPLLKRFLLGILIGVLVYRFISAILGLTAIIFSIFYIVCSKYLPTTSIKIDEIFSHIGKRLGILWNKPYVKAIGCVMLIIFPLLNSRPSPSMISVATPSIEQVLDITPQLKEFEEFDFPTFDSPLNVHSFLYSHTFRSDAGDRLNIRDMVYMNGKPITFAVKLETFSQNAAILTAYSPFLNTKYEIHLDRIGNTYAVIVMSLPTYSNVDVFYLID